MQTATAYYNELHDLPQELCTKPLALVGVSGLDTLNNAIHKSVWESLSSNRRVERAPVLFRLIGNAHEFPVVKPKRNSYDWYHPKGILKRNWMNKHLKEIPAVIVVFYDLDWNDAHWNEKMIECASRVQSMRAALEGRNTRITIVLLQSNVSLPAGEDILASERAVALCASCELNAKSLFVLPHGDHLQGYIVRLENAFFDLAVNYYHLEAKNIKSHRDHLNKSTHQYLFVRHQFKMGFLHELKQDTHTAHKHYTHAYNNLLEILIVDSNAMEIRTVAGCINYKLSKLTFGLNLPRDAISNFKAHIDRFKVKIGLQELAFEHYAWLSKQYGVFGDIFDEAVKLGLPAVQTQHPGIYYQQAAQYAIARKQACKKFCSNATTYPSPDPLEGAQYLEFYGQRPWRPGKHAVDALDPQIERNGIKALQYLENQVNHSGLIISLYGIAVSQYKTYRCLRTRRYLVLQMAEEYYNSRDYGKCLTLLTHMLWDFRLEKWWSLLSDILAKAFKCAYLVANVQDYVLLALEILGGSVTIVEEEKKRVYYNLHRLLKNQIPDADPSLEMSDIDVAQKLWQSALSTERLHLSLDMTNIISCVDCKARFTQAKYDVDQSVLVEVYIRNSSPFPLTFQRISVTVNTAEYTSEFAVDNKTLGNPTLEFKSKEIKQFLIEFTPNPKDVDKKIQIGSINLALGNLTDAVVDLKFNCGGSETISIERELRHFKTSKSGFVEFDNINPLSVASIVPRCSKIDIVFEHDKPSLLGEWYQINVIIKNGEELGIKNLQIEINSSIIQVETIDLSVEFSTSPPSPVKLPLIINLDNLTPKSERRLQFFTKISEVGEKDITVKASYNLENDAAIYSAKEVTEVISVVKPFNVETKFLSTLLEDIQKCYVGENFAVMQLVECVSPWPIEIENANVSLIPPLVSQDENVQSQIAGLTLQNSEIGTEVYLAVVQKQTEQLPTFGSYKIQWKRKDGCTTITELPIPGLPIDWIPLDLKINIPAYGLVRTPLLVTYHLHNKSHQLIELDVAMDGSEAFMFAGYKQLQVSVLPESVKVLNYNLYPLIVGSVALPKLTLTIPENSTEGPALRQDQLKLLVERTLPTHLFVMPQVKGHPKLPLVFEHEKSGTSTAVK